MGNKTQRSCPAFACIDISNKKSFSEMNCEYNKQLLKKNYYFCESEEVLNNSEKW